MKSGAACFLGLLLMMGVGGAQQKMAAGGDEAALKAIEEKWDAASLKGDTAALSGLLADSFVSTDAEGKVKTRAESFAKMKAGAVKYEIAKVSDMKVSVYGDAAVVLGQWKGKMTSDGKHIDTTERFTDTFIRQNGQWRCVASHSSTLK